MKVVMYSLNQRTNVLCNFLKQKCNGITKSRFNRFEYWVEDLGDFVVIHKDELSSYVYNTLKNIAVTSDCKYYSDDLKVIFKKAKMDQLKIDNFFASRTKEKVSGGTIRTLIEKTIGVEKFLEVLTAFYIENKRMREVIAQQNDIESVDEFFYENHYIYQLCLYEFV